MKCEFTTFEAHLCACEKKSGIKTLEELHDDLQVAIQLEFSTIPPYLSALYTLDPATNASAYTAVMGVLMEEMFHLTNAANVLIAVGGKPELNSTTFVPVYPTKLPNGEQWFEVGLLKFSQEALRTFKNIEIPGDMVKPKLITIGKFYERIQHSLDYLHGKMGDALFPTDTAPQVPAKYYYGGGGEITPVTDLSSAQFAINAIIAQGEGKPMGDWDPKKPFPLDEYTGILDGGNALFDQPRDIAHYFRFDELAQERRYVCGDSPASGPTGPKIDIDWDAVYNMHPNPTRELYRDLPELAALNLQFNRTFTRLLNELHETFNGDPDKLLQATGTMYELKYAAQALYRNPLPNSKEGYYASPTWEFLG